MFLVVLNVVTLVYDASCFPVYHQTLSSVAYGRETVGETEMCGARVSKGRCFIFVMKYIMLTYIQSRKSVYFLLLWLNACI